MFKYGSKNALIIAKIRLRSVWLFGLFRLC